MPSLKGISCRNSFDRPSYSCTAWRNGFFAELSGVLSMKRLNEVMDVSRRCPNLVTLKSIASSTPGECLAEFCPKRVPLPSEVCRTDGEVPSENLSSEC